MTKQIVDSEITIDGEFRNSAGALTDPTTVTFVYRYGPDGADTTIAATKVSTGLYRATLTPDSSANLYGCFIGTGDLVKTVPIKRPVHPKQVSVR